MQAEQDLKKLLRSIRNALWIIAAILLMGLGFQLGDLRRAPFAEIIMLAGFWSGLLLFISRMIALFTDLFVRPDDPEGQTDDKDAP